MSNFNTSQRVLIPDALREILLQFAISYLREQPGNIIDYAVEYFTNLQRNINQESTANMLENASTIVTTISRTPASMLSSSPKKENTINEEFHTDRRKSVFAESYDPEKDTDDDFKVNTVPKNDEEKGRLVKAVRKIFLFRSLDSDQMSQVINAMFEKNVEPNEYIIRQGDDGDNFFVIESGVYKAYVNDEHVHTYDNVGYFGELALLYNMPRAATIRAETKGKLWVMDRKTFRRIVLKAAYRKRKMYETLLDSVPMLKALQSYERMKLADALISKSYKKGEKIIEQGEPADGMYFIESGKVAVKIKENNKVVELTTLKKGQYFGELALLTNKPRAASVYAITDKVKLAFLDTEAFERLLGPCMEIMKRRIEDYETQLIKIFGSESKITDIR